MTVWSMRVACWIPKATNTHSQYVVRIDFPVQQWLKEGAVMLRYTYIACLVKKWRNPFCHTVRLKGVAVLLHITTSSPVTKS
jgi:hypothetical protein